MHSSRISLSFGFLLALLAATPVAHAACPLGFNRSTPTSDFTIDNANHLVTHLKTGLMWKQCAEGLSTSANAIAACDTGTATIITGWDAALSAAATPYAGYSDWRLPNQKELQSIVETACYDPSINETAFPNTPTSYYFLWSTTTFITFWSSTASSPFSHNKRDVYFYDGSSGMSNPGGNGYVRLVRGGQSFDSFDVQKTNQAITFANPGAQVMGTSPTLNATASSTLTPTFTSSTPSVCDISSGGTLTLHTTGTCTIAADQAGDASYNAAPQMTQSFEVVINGVCGSDNDQTLIATPANQCTAGNASSVTSGNTSYDWSCTGVNTGSNASCSSTRNYVVGSSVTGGNGTISSSQNVAYNATPSFTLTPSSGYVAGPVTGTCGGNLSGNSYTTNAVTADCTVVASFPTYTGNTPTNTGTATATLSGNGGANCGFTSAGFVQPSSTPPGVTFPQGLFNFTLGNCTQGNSVIVTVTYPSAVPAGAQYWKYGPTSIDHSNHWYTIPASINGNSMIFSITDGGLGDDDYTANGAIADAGGQGLQAATAIPTLPEWGMILLAGMLGLFGVGVMRRR